MRRLLLVALFAFGCGGSLPPARELEAVTFESPTRFWITGSSGRTLYFADGVEAPRDYPMDPDLDPFFYEPIGEVPTAMLRLVDREPVLFLRTGEIFRWKSGWQTFPHRIPPEHGDERPQFDQVLVAPGRIWIQVHSQVLISARSLDDFANGSFVRSETPTFFTHLALLGSRLYGIGWDTTGYIRTVFDHSGTSFQPVLSLGRDGVNEIVGIFHLADQSPVAVIRAGLVPVYANTSLAPFTGLVKTLGRNPEHTPRTDATWSGVARVFAGERGRALLVLEQPNSPAQAHDVVELRNDAVIAYRCGGDLSYSAIGALPLSRGYRVVTKTPAVVDIPGPTCREVNLSPSSPIEKSPPVLQVPE